MAQSSESPQDMGKLLQVWIAADMKVASAEKRISEGSLGGCDDHVTLTIEAERLRVIADAAQ